MACCCCYTLDENEQALIKSCDGFRSIENGPGCFFLNICSDLEKRPAIVLAQGEYCIVMNDESGEKRSVYGPGVDWMTEREYIVLPKSYCPHLSKDQFLVVRDEATGQVRNEVGPLLFRPGPYDRFDDEPEKVYNLSKNEYLRVKDQDGKIQIIQGECRYYPEPLDEVVGGVQSAVNVDEHHAVLVRNEDLGTLQLYTEHGVFFPGPYQQILQVQEKIILEEYHTMVYKDETGKFHYVRGDSEMRNFFLPPFCEVVKQQWSTDLRKEHGSWEEKWKFDRRPTYMNYEFNCRTVDNVELVVDVSFYWAIIDVKMMIEKTADAPGDTCTHARSKIIQEVSRIKLMDFLEQFNDIIRRACMDDSFYEERGVRLLSVEVLKFECASAETNKILQDIIKETADRLKKKEWQKGENEVALSRLEGEIEEEKMKKELIELKKSHLKTEARIEGEAESTKLSSFLRGLTGKEQNAMDTEKAMKMYVMLRKLDSIQALASSRSQLYVTPNDVNLTVGQLFPTHPGAPSPQIME